MSSLLYCVFWLFSVATFALMTWTPTNVGATDVDKQVPHDLNHHKNDQTPNHKPRKQPIHVNMNDKQARPLPPQRGGLPRRSLGFYILLADDTVDGYTSDDDWQPQLYDYQSQGANVLWFTFINPSNMTVPKSFINFTKCRNEKGCPSSDQLIIWSIGGMGYCQDTWPWLNSQESAELMAEQVSKWFINYGIDGIDLDIEGNAGNDQQASQNLVYFAAKLRNILNSYGNDDDNNNKRKVITQPVYGYPQILAEIAMVNNGWNTIGESYGLIDSVGIMVYNNSASLKWIPDYAQGSQMYQGFPITCDVPTHSIMAGIQGTASSEGIKSLANSVIRNNLGGIMVWYASVYDATRNKPALNYGSDDASSMQNQTGDVWIETLKDFSR